MRVVFDTNTVISALLFRGKLRNLVDHWQQASITPLICEQTRTEFLRVLSYPKFKLCSSQIETLASRYLPYTETVDVLEQAVKHLPECRDNKDQIFLELAFIGKADILVTGDADLLVLKEQIPFNILPPAEYMHGFIVNPNS